MTSTKRARRRIGMELGFGLAGIIMAPTLAHAAEYYVSTTGSDSQAGTKDAPFATLSKANSAASAGDTIWVRGGTYYVTSQLVLSKSGTSDSNRTKIWAYEGETPVLDASKYVSSNASVDVPVVLLSGSWMHLRGLEIANAKIGASGDHSYSLLRTKNASHNTFELLNLHHGFGSGLFVDTGEGGNLILNCDSHDNYDKEGSQGDGQNGDGFGVHYQTTGPSTVIRGCRAWMNSDDGYDFISQEVPITIENSFAMQNGHGSEGNGNGFKIGSSKTGIRHIVQHNVAWKNKSSGFYANHSSGGNTWLNNTSYNNGTQYNMLASPADDTSSTITLSGSLAHKMRNNVGFPNKNSNMGGVDSASNSWDLNLGETSADFESTTDTGCTDPREADGSIPAACAFLKLKVGSPLIDKGTDVGLPYEGAAPDLGAYEYGATASGGGAGGVAGEAGASRGAGGSTGSTGGAAGRKDPGASAGGGGANGVVGRGGASAGDGGAGASSVTGIAGRAAPGTDSSAIGGGGGRADGPSDPALSGSGGSRSIGAGGATQSSGSGSASPGTGDAGSTASGSPNSRGCGCVLAGGNPSHCASWAWGVGAGLLARQMRRRRASRPKRRMGGASVRALP